MFRNIISDTPFTTPAADSYFGDNVRGDAFCGDVSFTSTLRALLMPRMKEGDLVAMSMGSSSYTASQISSTPLHRLVRVVYRDDGFQSGSIRIHRFTGSDADNQACLRAMKEAFCSTYSGWYPLEKITEFYKKQFPVLCFINPECKKVVLFTNDIDTKEYHYLQCSILAFLPWYFNPDEGVTELEMDLIQSLRDRTSDKYEACLRKIAEGCDFRESYIRKLLDGFETIYEKNEAARERIEIERLLENISELSRRIGEYNRVKRDREIRLLGLETAIANSSGESEIMDYFIRNKKLSLHTVNDNGMRFVVSDVLEYFDEDMAAKMIENDRSYVYRPHGGTGRINPDDMKLLMRAIFLDQSLKINFCAAYEFKFGEYVRAINNFSYSSEFSDFMPNTHTDRYSCMGNYESMITELVKDNNYIMALEQCIASCKSLNFGDSIVMNEFMNRLYGTSDFIVNNKCIVLPNGSVVKPVDAIKFLKSETEGN